MIPRHGIMALVLSACIAYPQMARSATVICAGTVESVGVHQPGMVFLRLSSMNTSAMVCRLDVDFAPAGSGHTTTPAVCKQIYAALLLARSSGRTLNSVYLDGDTVPASCNAFASWTQVSLRYFDF